MKTDMIGYKLVASQRVEYMFTCVPHSQPPLQGLERPSYMTKKGWTRMNVHSDNHNCFDLHWDRFN